MVRNERPVRSFLLIESFRPALRHWLTIGGLFRDTRPPIPAFMFSQRSRSLADKKLFTPLSGTQRIFEAVLIAIALMAAYLCLPC